MAERHVHTYNRRSIKVITRRAALPGACFVIAAYAGFTVLRKAGVVTGISGDAVALAALTMVLAAFVVRLVPQHRAYEVGFREGENFGANVRTLRRWSRWRCAGQGVLFLIAFGLLGLSTSLVVGLAFRDGGGGSEAAQYRQRQPRTYTVPPITVSASPTTPSKPASAATTTHVHATKTVAAEQSPRPTSAPAEPTPPEPSKSPPSPSSSPQETGMSSPPASPDGDDEGTTAEPTPDGPVRTLLRRLGSLL